MSVHTPWPPKESLQRLSWPHQVTYDVVATPIRPTNTWAMKKMLLYYHGQLLRVTRSCWLPYSQREIRYGRQLRSLQRLRWPHQVTYDVVATPIRPTNTWAVKKMLLYYHGQLLRVTRSCWLPYSQREIRYGRRLRSLQRLRWPHQVTYDVVATPIRRTNAWAVKKMLLSFSGGTPENCSESLFFRRFWA